MRDFRVHITGTSGAVAAFGRFPSGHLVKSGSDYILIDCGEGIQFRLEQYKWKKSGITKILITHLHGDHYFGLPGLLTTMMMQGRVQGLDIYSPPGLEACIRPLILRNGEEPKFALRFHELDTTREMQLHLEENFEIRSFPLRHAIPCCGFLLRERNIHPSIRKDLIAGFELTHDEIKLLKSGTPVIRKDGVLLKPEDFIRKPAVARSYAYCSDTVYHEELVPFIEGVTVLYHESTFTEVLAAQALKTHHSTAMQAADIARKAGAGTLWLGHFSARYKEIEVFETEARTIFENSLVLREGLELDV